MLYAWVRFAACTGALCCLYGCAMLLVRVRYAACAGALCCLYGCAFLLERWFLRPGLDYEVALGANSCFHGLLCTRPSGHRRQFQARSGDYRPSGLRRQTPDRYAPAGLSLPLRCARGPLPFTEPRAATPSGVCLRPACGMHGVAQVRSGVGGPAPQNGLLHIWCGAGPPGGSHTCAMELRPAPRNLDEHRETPACATELSWAPRNSGLHHGT